MTFELLAQIQRLFIAVFGPILQWEANLTVSLNSLPESVLVLAHWISESVYLMLALVVFFAWKNHSYRRAIYFIFIIFVNTVLATFFKLWVNEPRPVAPNAIDTSSSSFPSRHALLAWTGFGLAADPAVRPALPTWLMASWAIAISVSRLVLGVHYLHDLIAAVIIGYMATWLLMRTKKQVKFRLFDLKRYPKKITINKKYQKEILRQTFHMVTGVVIALIAFVLPEYLHIPAFGLVVLAAFSISATVRMRVRRKMKYIPYLITLTYVIVAALASVIYFLWDSPMRVLGPIIAVVAFALLWKADTLIAKLERSKDLKSLPLKGMIMFMLGCFLTSIFFDHTTTVAAIMILALGDGTSTFFGILFGKNWIFYNDVKAWEGIAAGIIIAFFGVLPFLPPRVAVIATTLPMLLESADARIGKHRIDDNLSIPLLAGAIISLLM